MASKSFLKYLNEYENKGYDGVFSEDKYPRSSKDAVTGQTTYEKDLKPVISGTEFIQNTVKAGVAPQEYNFLAEPKQFGPQSLPDDVKKNLNQYAEYRKNLETPTGNKLIDTFNAITLGAEKFNKNKVVSFGAGANPLTWNKSISDIVYTPELSKKMEESKQENPNTAMAGELVTSLIPMAKASQLVGKIPKLANIGNKFAKTAAIEGTAGLGYGTVEGLYRGESLEDSLKRGALYGAGGATLGQLGNLGKYALPTAGGIAGAGYGGYVEGKQALERGEILSDNAGKIINNALIGGLAGVAGGAGLYLASKPVGKAIDNYLDKSTTNQAIKNINNAMQKYSTQGVFANPTTNILLPPTNFQKTVVSKTVNGKKFYEIPENEYILNQASTPKQINITQLPESVTVLRRTPAQPPTFTQAQTKQLENLDRTTQIERQRILQTEKNKTVRTQKLEELNKNYNATKQAIQNEQRVMTPNGEGVVISKATNKTQVKVGNTTRYYKDSDVVQIKTKGIPSGIEHRTLKPNTNRDNIPENNTVEINDNAQSNLKPLNNDGNMNLPSSNKNASESIEPPNRPIEANAVWKNQDFDQPVTVIGEAGVMNGKKYYKIQGSNSAIPEDELIFNNVAQSSQVSQGTPPAQPLRRNSGVTQNVNMPQSQTQRANPQANTQTGTQIPPQNVNQNIPQNTTMPQTGTGVGGGNTGGAGQPFVSPTIDRIADDVASRRSIKEWFKDMYEKIADDTFGSKAFDKAAGSDVQRQMVNSKKAGSTGDYIARERLTDMEGNDLGKGLAEMVKSIPKEQREAFKDYMLNKHNISRHAEGKPIWKDITAQDSLNTVQNYEAMYPDFAKFSDDFREFQRGFKESWLVKSGLISKDVSDLWDRMYPDYINTSRIFDEIEEVIESGALSKSYVNQKAPVDKIKGPSDALVKNPFANTIEQINRVVRVARKNEVAQMVYRELQKNPTGLNNFGEILQGQPQKITDNIVTALVDGEKVYMKINDKRFLRSLLNLTNSYVDGGVIKKLNQGFKNLVTQYNPIFGVANVVRDIPTSYIKGSEKNPLKYVSNYASAYRDIYKNADIYKQYKALGGSSQGFFNADKATKYMDEIFNDSRKYNPIKYLQLFNEITETAPRLAEFKTVLNKTGNIQEALYRSGEVTTNFSRGGKWSKTIDIGVPYFNASIVGLDNTIRYAIKNPKSFFAKGIATIAIPTIGFDIWNNIVDPQNYKDLDNRTKDENFVIMTGDGEYIKLPKSRELGVLFSSLGQRIYRQMKGEPEAFKGFPKYAMLNVSPVNIIENNLLAPFAYNLPSNKDFADRPIVPEYMKNWDKRIQYDEKTSEIAKKIGEIANLSPKQVDYVIKSYTGVLSQVFLPYTTKDGNNNLIAPLIRRFSGDVAYSNKQVNDFYDNLKSLNTKAETKNQTQKIPSKEVTEEEKMRNNFQKVSEYMSFIRKESKLGTNEQKRDAQLKIMNMAKNMNDTLKLPPNVSKSKANKFKPRGFDNKK